MGGKDMRTTTIFNAVVVATLALVCSRVMAQEVVPAPDPIGGTKTDAVIGGRTDVPPPPSPSAAAPTDDSWRYRRYDGRWWFWSPQNRWLWYSNDGRWVVFNDNPTPAAPYRAHYYPSPQYPTPGYYGPGVVVGARPYGNVNVGVGRRVGVDVWGSHGAVRVGRIYVGW
jgi:hypothetical protein